MGKEMEQKNAHVGNIIVKLSIDLLGKIFVIKYLYKSPFGLMK
jgi:hypothetical protein